MKTIDEVANEIVNDLNKNGTIQFAGLNRSPDHNELTRAIARKAIEIHEASRVADVVASKVWTLEDVDATYDDRFAADHDLSPEQRAEVVASAAQALERGALVDCADYEWDAIADALEEAIEAVSAK